MKLNKVIISSIFVLSLLFSACGSRHVQAKNSGFFKDYSEVNIKEDKSLYKNIILEPVIVISSITKDKQTDTQVKLYKKISAYLTLKLKNRIKENSRYKLVDNKAKDTLILQSAISTVEVHFEDKNWDNNTPVTLGLSAMSFSIYMDEAVRILGEGRLVDSMTGEVISRSMNISKDDIVSVNGDSLVFSDLKPALDTWLKAIKKDL